MKQFLILFFLLPFFVFAQTKPKPAVKPKTGTTAKKPATTAKKPAVAPGPKKPNPAVLKLVEKAYGFYRESKDAECEKVIKQILALDPKNKEAHLLRANIAMFAENQEVMWLNLNKIYKMYPSEPEVYSQFAMTHLNYYFLGDSVKRVLCRKTIKLASRAAEGYVTLGMVAAVGGYYQEALDYFDISLTKTWKDTASRVILNLPYARCLYETGDTVLAIEKLDALIPRLGGNDKYTCVFLRAKYKLDMGNTDIANDIDTLNSFAPEQTEIMILSAKYLNKTGRSDSACGIAKKVRLKEGGEAFDMSEFCKDIQKTLDLTKYKKLTYGLGTDDFIINIDKFDYPKAVSFNWTRVGAVKGNPEQGTVVITRKSLDSSYFQTNFFENGSDVTLDKTITVWLSKRQFKDLQKDSTTQISTTNTTLSTYRIVGHEQVDIYDSQNKVILVDCIVLSDGTSKITYLNDEDNPLIIKIEMESFSIILTKIE